MHEDLARLDHEMRTALMGLTAGQTQARPAEHPEKWSIQQIGEHLLLTYRSTAGVIQKRIERGSSTQASPSLQQRLGQFGLISLGIFPPGRKAPAAVVPSLPATVQSGDGLAERMLAELMEVDRLTAEGERLFGGARAASHMVLGPLSMRQWRRFHLVHGRHHVAQIVAIRAEHSL